jgi:hypothetical protein
LFLDCTLTDFLSELAAGASLFFIYLFLQSIAFLSRPHHPPQSLASL